MRPDIMDLCTQNIRTLIISKWIESEREREREKEPEQMDISVGFELCVNNLIHSFADQLQCYEHTFAIFEPPCFWTHLIDDAQLRILSYPKYKCFCKQILLLERERESFLSLSMVISLIIHLMNRIDYIGRCSMVIQNISHNDKQSFAIIQFYRKKFKFEKWNTRKPIKKK